MTTLPIFPEFKLLTLEDRPAIHERLWAYQPSTSELTFVNLYIWRNYYHFQWSLHEDWLLLVAEHDARTFALPPVGPASRLDVTRTLLRWLRDARGVAAPTIERADRRLADELAGADDLIVEEAREHFDYVYRSADLGQLAGRKYSKKRNHISQFLREYTYTYAPLTEDLVQGCLDLAEVWCKQRLCEEDISLQHEFCGIHDALTHLRVLAIAGGAILMDGKVQAFALGELLNAQTAVVHIEKANPNFHGVYPMINKEFAGQRWQDVPFINREQDLGDPGLRRAKESYYPDHLVEKYRVRGRE